MSTNIIHFYAQIRKYQLWAEKSALSGVMVKLKFDRKRYKTVHANKDQQPD